jgi:hypothetical protein
MFWILSYVDVLLVPEIVGQFPAETAETIKRSLLVDSNISFSFGN